VLLVVIEAQCKYRRPARYDDLLTLRTTLAMANAVKIVHTYRLLRGGELLAEGRTTLACVDRQGNLQRIPEWLRAEPSPAALAGELEPAPDARTPRP
jgi:acyl-CoA thioester hydrolase